MPDVTIAAFAVAFGYAVAGAIASLYRLVASDEADFITAQATVVGNIAAVVFVMFGGPAIVSRKLAAGVVRGRFKIGLAAVGALLSLVWALCAGLLYVNLLAAA